jgi:hypothetical protein
MTEPKAQLKRAYLKKQTQFAGRCPEIYAIGILNPNI